MPWVDQTGPDNWRVRYRRTDGTIASIPGFPDETTANNYIDDMETDKRRGKWIDPTGGQTTVGAWASEWIDSLDIDRRTEENYRSFLKVHILPRWGTIALADITNSKARAWEKKLRNSGLADSTVASIMKCFSLMLSDAADEPLIEANPIQNRRRGRRRRTQRRPRQIWGEPGDVLAVSDQVALCYGPAGAVLVTTAGWTGARWGELVGLQRPNMHLFDDNTGKIVVDPDIGALHEPSEGGLFLGPPKTDASVRDISLPPFLVVLLRAHIETHDHPHVFVTPQSQLHRRSNFGRRAFRPAADGNARKTNPDVRLRAVKPGLKFHGLRHSHKTWMIDDGIPEIAQALRLGHVLQDKVQETYSHVAGAVEQRLLDALQTRWEKAVAGSTTPSDQCAWRAVAA
jgi:integrase